MSVLGPPPSGVAPERPVVLCVDDEPMVLEGLRDMLRRSFDVHVATSGAQGLELLRSTLSGVAILISDMHMPIMSGAEFLRLAGMTAPDAVPILLTGGSEVQDAAHAINAARLFRFLTKPCDQPELMRACAAALHQHRMRTVERDLLEQTVRGSVDALTDALALTAPAIFGRSVRVRGLVGDLARARNLADRWAIEVAAALAHLGAMSLPRETAEKLYADAQLTPEELAMVQRVPHNTQRLLKKIPRMEKVIAILDACQPRLDGTCQPPVDDEPIGAQTLRVATVYVDLEAAGTDPHVALGAMRSRGCYDPALLAALGDVVGTGPADVHEVKVGQLEVGMVFADDVRSQAGNLLVASGQPATENLIERLTNLRGSAVREPLRVFAQRPNG